MESQNTRRKSLVEIANDAIEKYDSGINITHVRSSDQEFLEMVNKCVGRHNENIVDMPNYVKFSNGKIQSNNGK